MIGDLHFHRGYSLRLQESKPLKNNGIISKAIHALRMRVERTFAWEDKFKRLLLRFERIQQRHYGMKLMAYTLINLRSFCGA
jgi:transposase